MSPQLPVVTSRQAEQVARKLGFVLHHHTGSHAIYLRASDRARAVIPVHAGRNLKPKALLSVLDGLRVTPEEFRALL